MLEQAQEDPGCESARQSSYACINLGISQNLMPCTWALDFWYGGKLTDVGVTGYKALFETFMILETMVQVIGEVGAMTNDLVESSDGIRPDPGGGQPGHLPWAYTYLAHTYLGAQNFISLE
ncbi:hypothetical protein POM88_021447 [Heracleum sosnowskyi]|uniref:Uncharacterized protein n=1 Tax=Heracleum sosnowskyi TaxID=360622 RepID=A0AAD8IFU3_9APIA|nr:hypothetical protein POM88_021447 [Heracleum sosnowskyi]